MQIKIGIISVLSKYEVQVSGKTPIPVVYDQQTIVLAAKGEFMLKIMNRSDKA